MAVNGKETGVLIVYKGISYHNDEPFDRNDGQLNRNDLLFENNDL